MCSLFVGALVLAGCQADKTSKMTIRYENPLWDGYFADPQVLETNGEYYAYGTGLAPDGCHFPILHSTDFVNWEYVGGAIAPLQDPKFDLYWAPEVVEKDGKFYLYYAGDMKMRVAVADSPVGPFVDAGKYMFPELDFSIDGHAFLDPVSEEWYFFYARDFFDKRPGTALSVVRLGDDMMTPVGESKTVLRAFDDWQIYERNRTLYNRQFDAWHTIEGATVVYKDGKYHCFYSGGNWQTPGYGVGCAVSDDVMGPYVDKNSKGSASVIKSIPGKLIGPGHNSVILGPDGETWFNVYHSWNEGQTKRQLCIDPIVWTKKGPKTYNPSRGVKEVTLPIK